MEISKTAVLLLCLRIDFSYSFPRIRYITSKKGVRDKCCKCLDIRIINTVLSSLYLCIWKFLMYNENDTWVKYLKWSLHWHVNKAMLWNDVRMQDNEAWLKHIKVIWCNIEFLAVKTIFFISLLAYCIIVCFYHKNIVI